MSSKLRKDTDNRMKNRYTDKTSRDIWEMLTEFTVSWARKVLYLTLTHTFPLCNFHILQYISKGSTYY